MRIVSSRAVLLERSLQGLPCPDHEVRSLVTTASRIPALTSPACAPREEFVSALGLQLSAEALNLPARVPSRTARRTSSRSSPTVTGGSAPRPVVLVIGRGLRVMAGAAASLLLIGAVLGITSRSALPGGLLYPMKQMLNSAAVQLAGSDLDRGTTLLSQADGHIGDARTLVERDRALADPVPVNEALRNAYESATTGQRLLLGGFDRTQDPQALIAVQDFTSRALPQLAALRQQVPQGSRPGVDALIALLQRTRVTLAGKVAACGQPCASITTVDPVRGPDRTPTTDGFLTPARGLRLPGLPTSGLTAAGQAPAITSPGAVVVGPGVPQLPVPKVATLPAVKVGPITVRPSPIVVPRPPSLMPKAPAPVVPPLPTTLPGLP